MTNQIFFSDVSKNDYNEAYEQSATAAGQSFLSNLSPERAHQSQFSPGLEPQWNEVSVMEWASLFRI